MKQKSKFLATILLLVLTISVLSSLPITFAEGADAPLETDASATINNYQSQIQVINSDDTVTYSGQEKSFSYRRGGFDSTSMSVTDGDKSFGIVSYDWYIVDYMQSYVLVADISSYLSFTEQAIPVAVFLYPAGVRDLSDQTFDIGISETPTIRLVYTNINESFCNKVIAPISQEVFSQIYNLANSLVLSKENTDEVSQMLIESFSYENNYKLSLSNNSQAQHLSDEQVATMSTIEYANEAQTVRCNAYDNYTDTDNCIEDYYLKYYGKYMTYYDEGEMLVFNDDAIVNIIPRNLFITPGIYSYVGKEYGFFIKTENVGGEILSTYMVFDIDVVEPYPQRSNDDPAPSVTVAPAITGTSEYVDGNVVAYPYSEGKLALANINVAVSVCNATEKNIGDTGYVASEDYGYAISSYEFNATGTGPKKDVEDINISFLELTLGAIDAISMIGAVYAGHASKALEGTIDFVSTLITSNQRSISTLSRTNNTFNTSGAMIGNTNTNSMIANYGNLVKGFSCQVLNSSQEEEDDYPLLYKTTAHSFYVQYGFCQKNADINWDALVATKVSVDIVQDDTKINIFGDPVGEILFIDSTSGGRVDSYNEIPSSSDGGTIEEDKFYRAAFAKDEDSFEDACLDEDYTSVLGSYKDFYFTPNRTHLYVIETFNQSPNADAFLHLYDSQGNYLTGNDDSGVDRNAKIIRTLTGGQTYKIRTMCYNYEAGAYDFIVRKYATLTEPTQTTITPTNLTLQNDTIWLSFTPRGDGYYTFTTTGTMDSYLTLYDSNYNKFTFDDDDGVSYNGLIEIYLIGGQTYYLNVRQYSLGSGQCSVYVSKQYEIVYDEIVQPHFYFDVEYESPQFFRFTPTATKNYTFTLEKEISGDPVMELYNSSWVLLTSDDDSAGDSEPRITYTLQAGQTYYIKVRGYNGTDEYGYLYFE